MMSKTYLYHIADPKAYDESLKNGLYYHPSLSKEGFIHCSLAEQLEETANLYYPSVNEIRILKLNQALIEAKVIYEQASRGVFPHIFGPLNMNSVVYESILVKSGDGLFHFSEDLMKD